MECFGLKIVILVNIGQLVGVYWEKDFEQQSLNRF